MGNYFGNEIFKVFGAVNPYMCRYSYASLIRFTLAGLEA